MRDAHGLLGQMPCAYALRGGETSLERSLGSCHSLILSLLVLATEPRTDTVDTLICKVTLVPETLEMY